MKFKKFLKAHQPLVKDVATSTCLIGASAGIVFGISAGMFKIEYMPLNSPEARLFASENNNYRGENILSGWNMRLTDTIQEYTPPPTKSIKLEKGLNWWKGAHPGAEKAPWQKAEAAGALADIEEEGEGFTNDAIKARHNLVGMVIDGSTQSTMDRSFNQSLYEGLVDYIKNKPQTAYDAENQNDPIGKNTAFSYKPAQDNTTEFINIYLSAMEKHTVLGLAGFQHATPLNSLMIHNEGGEDGKLKPLAETSDPKTTKEVNETAFLLVDSNIPNNQNIASVQFRADQPGFLTALATCQYFFNNLDMYHDKYQDLAVGAFGGVQIPTVTIYMGGFQRGIELFNNVGLKNILEKAPTYYFEGVEPPPRDKHYVDTFADLLSHSKYKEDCEGISAREFLDNFAQKLFDEYSIKMIKLGDIGTHFSGTFAAGDAIGLTKQYLNRGASAIVAVAGPQSLDAAQEIRNQNSKAIVIGVDTAMENSDYQRFHSGCDEKSREQHVTSDKYMDKTKAPDDSTPENANGIIKFSAIKDIKRVTKQITRLSLKGDLWDVSTNLEDVAPDGNRAICGPGFQTCGNILNGLISISWDGFYPLIQALENIEYYETKEGGGPSLTLGELWFTKATQYLNEHDELLDTPYAGLVTDINNLKTYNKKDGNGKILYDHYNHTIAILGSIMEGGYLDFDRTMTLRQKEGAPTEYEMLGEGEKERYTLLNWLTINMYLTC